MLLNILFTLLFIVVIASMYSCSGSDETPSADAPWVILTDHSKPQAWNEIKNQITQSSILGFKADVKLIDLKKFDGKNRDEILALIQNQYPTDFVFIVDVETFASTEHPILVVDFMDDVPNEFRATPEQIQGIENNLSIANMDFFDFANAVDADGIFRGFK